MKIAVLSNTRRPTRPDGPHGLGRTAHAIAQGLAHRGHDITLFAGPGSQFEEGELLIHRREGGRIAQHAFDAYLDSSHAHDLSREQPDWPVLNRLGDRECRYQPPNAIVETEYMRGNYPAARVVRKGIDAANIPFFPVHQGYLAYFGQIIGHKGYRRALDVGELAGRVVHVAGPNYENAHLPAYHGVLYGHEKWRFIGGAEALLHPSLGDAGPRTPLEAAACGTPTLCLDGDGAMEHVAHCVSGFVCMDLHEMADALGDLPHLPRRRVREWVLDEFPLDKMLAGYENALLAVAAGERW